MNYNEQELKKIFSSEFWENIPEVKPKSTSFIGSILKSNENRIQALLTYCLSPNEGHEINPIFFEALCECISELGVDFFIDDYYEGYEILSEYTCEKNGRIDILIKTKEPWDATRKAIIIEMKLDSILHNNLEDYYDSVTDCREENKIGIVLGINDISNTISHDKFHFLSLNQFFEKIKVIYEKEEKDLNDESYSYFFKDFFTYIEKFKRNFLDIETKEHLNFLFEHQQILLTLRNTIKDNSSKNWLNKWYLINKHNLNKISLSKDFAFNSISDFTKDWLKVNNRNGQVREIGKLFFRGIKESIFKDFYRFSLDYTECLDFSPLVKLRLEIANNFDSVTAFGVTQERIYDLLQNLSLSSQNESNMSANFGWTEVIKVNFSDPNEIIDFHDFFYQKITPIINQIENSIEQNIFSKYKLIIQKNLMNNGSDKLELDNSELVDSINEDIIFREPCGQLLITIHWQSIEKISISIWSTTRSEEWLQENLIKSKVDNWKIHSFDDASCLYNVDLVDNCHLSEIYRNFSIEISIESINEIRTISQKSDEIFALISEMKRIELEEKF
jgi:hypothetical protein